MRLTIEELTLTDDRLRNLPRRFRAAGQRLVRRTALDVERRAKVHAPVDTGFLRNSIYTVTAESSGYAEAWRIAKEIAPRVFLEEMVRPSELSALVMVGAEYGAFVEFGTARMAAQPYLRPAVEEAREAWRRGVAELFDEATR